jgi:hypothetical protein
MSSGSWGGQSVHRLSPPAVRAAGDRALAELPLVIEFRITIDGVEADLASYARSQCRAVRADGSWRIAGITSIYERDALGPAVPGTHLDIDPKELAAYRPSHRYLAWYQSRLGFPAPIRPARRRTAGTRRTPVPGRSRLARGVLAAVTEKARRLRPGTRLRPGAWVQAR